MLVLIMAKPKQAMYFIGLRGKDNLQSLDARTRKNTPVVVSEF
jgi:hypothetical protein